MKGYSLSLLFKGGYGTVYALQVFTHRHVCRCSPCFRFYVLHFPFTHVSTFFMKHPQCNRHPVAHLQLERQSAASFVGGLKIYLQSCIVVFKYGCEYKRIVNVP